MLAEFFLFRTKKGCGIDASILSKLLTPHTTRQKPKMGVQNAELVRTKCHLRTPAPEASKSDEM